MKEDEEEVSEELGGATSDGMEDGLGGCGDTRVKTEATCGSLNNNHGGTDQRTSSDYATSDEGSACLDDAPHPLTSFLGEPSCKEDGGVDLSEAREDTLCGTSSCNNRPGVQLEASDASCSSESEESLLVQNM